MPSLSIHPLIVALALLYAGVMWFLSYSRRRYLADSRLFALAYFVQAVLYFVFVLVDWPAEVRSFYVRISLLVVALSQAIPLHILMLHRRPNPTQKEDPRDR
jgi:hypothetical protein